MTHFLLGLDLSTTGSKALLLDESGTVVAVASSPHSLSTPRPLWSEQDPQEWWSATRQAIGKVLAQEESAADRIQAVGLTGQMHGLVLLDEAGEVLRPAILWNDQRTQDQCDEIHDRVGQERLIRITGNPMLTGFTAPKMLWVRQNEPEIYARVRTMLLPKDYIRYRLSGEIATDVAGGSGTNLFDLGERSWSSELLDLLEIEPNLLPPIFESAALCAEVSSKGASETGLRGGTPIVAGAGDQAAQAVGVGAVEPGVLALTLGTSGVVFASTGAPHLDPEGRLHAFCHALPDTWHLMGVMLSAAGSLAWFRDMLAPTTSFEDLMLEAASAPAGSEDLLFLPYLSGERTPHADPLARGAFVGLTLRHRRAEMIRSVIEGVAFGLRDSFELIREVQPAGMQEIRISGGGARSVLWRQILASVLGESLVSVDASEGAALGAALLAGVGAGVWPDVVSACRVTVRLGERTDSNVSDIEMYESAYRRYRRLYPALREI